MKSRVVSDAKIDNIAIIHIRDNTAKPTAHVVTMISVDMGVGTSSPRGLNIIIAMT